MNKTVLIIDDDDMLRTGLRRGLEAAEFCVLDAANAQDADDILKRVSVDAIVLDRMMVGMDGLTFLKNLRAGGINTPTIMLTAMGGAENAIDGLSGGADDYLSKPFQLQELILRIKNMMRHGTHQTIQMPSNILYADDEFFIQQPSGIKYIAWHLYSLVRSVAHHIFYTQY